MYTMRQDVYDFMVEHPQTKSFELVDRFGVSTRTGRRMVQNWKKGTAVRASTPEVRAVYDSMQNYDPEHNEWEIEEFLDEAAKLVAEKEQSDPIITHDRLNLDKVANPIGIVFGSCMHLGGRYTAHAEFRDYYAKLLEIPGLYFASLGDDIEGFPSFFRDVDAVQQQLLPLDRQIDLLRYILTAASDSNKLLFGTGSQHGGKWLLSKEGKNRVKEMYMNDFNVPFYDGAAYLRLLVGKTEYQVAVSHEFPGNSQYNPNHPQKRALLQRFPNADVIVMGDKHTPALQYQTVYQDEYHAGNRNSTGVWLLQSGTFKIGPDRFAVANGYPSGEFGWPIVIFHPEYHHIEVTFSLMRAAQMLEKPLSNKLLMK